MTRDDWTTFAAAALPGVIARNEGCCESDVELVCEYADAMVAELEKRRRHRSDDARQIDAGQILAAELRAYYDTRSTNDDLGWLASALETYERNGGR